MAAHAIDARILAQLRLALTGLDGDGRAAELERQARATGLTGAEIDAARDGWCFDVRADAAVGYARALRAGEARRLQAALAHAKRSGLGAPEIEAIERLSRGTSPAEPSQETPPCAGESGTG